jgi:hypothetical protein
MLRKIIIGFMLSFICFVQLGCCSLSLYKSNSELNAMHLNAKFSKSKGKLVNQNFVFLSKFVMTKNQNDYTQICYKGKHLHKDCNDPLIPVNSASGYIVKVDKKNNELYALTAAHWCEPVTKDELYDSTDLIFDDLPLIGYYVTFMGENYKIKRYIMDPINDLCLVYFKSKHSKYAKNVNITKKEPVIGEEIHAISAPNWSYETEFRQHYDGKSSGCDDFECAFTLPATYGSSGSAIINERGEIVSIISRAAIGFNNYTIGARPDQVKIFFEKAYETIRR